MYRFITCIDLSAIPKTGRMYLSVKRQFLVPTLETFYVFVAPNFLMSPVKQAGLKKGTV